MNKYYIFLLIFQLVFNNQYCFSQSQSDNFEENYNRQAAVAGQFYPDNDVELKAMLKDLFSDALPKEVDNSLAIISPHAGYVYSGKVAATSFNQVNPNNHYENVFVIASSHRAYFEGASIYSIGNYVTPLGEVKVNRKLANKLIDDSEFFSYVAKAHVGEHSLEVQLPFLQYHLKSDFQIVPIVIGTQDKKVCYEIAKVLKPYFNDDNLFVISSDFSHYPTYEDANICDIKAAEAIVKNKPDVFMAVINEKSNNSISGLSTRACGWSSVLSLLYITENLSDIAYKHLLYQNSGDTKYGDKNRVVGYNSIVVYRLDTATKDIAFNLSEKDKKDLLTIARSTVENVVKGNEISNLKSSDFSEVLNTPCGAFVTLNKNHKLRGCIGSFKPEQPLFAVVQKMAIAAATQDRRFVPVMKYELNDIQIEISVLSPMKKISSTEDIELGKHGIYIKSGVHTGTFLPQVATETDWTLEEFLGHCARDKAGLTWDGWKNADVYIYEALVFSENENY